MEKSLKKYLLPHLFILKLFNILDVKMKLDEEFIKEDDTWYKMIQNDLWDIGKYRISSKLWVSNKRLTLINAARLCTHNETSISL